MAGGGRSGGGGGKGRGPRSGAGIGSSAAQGGGGGGGTNAASGGGGHAEEDTARHRREVQQLSEAVAAGEREGGYQQALSAFQAHPASQLPLASLWRVHLELAECAKRGGVLSQVKRHLALALQAQPRTMQVWLESCRTLDELGEVEECRSLLERGLEVCSPNDQLSLKLVRVLERLQDHTALRSHVGALRREPLERVCKVLLDAAHFEVRAGNGKEALQLFHSLLQRLPHQGPIYCETCRVEALLGNWRMALLLAEHGVQTCLKYGPLWFALLRYAEKIYGAKAVLDYGSFALRNICHELHWKVHFEVAAAFSREHNLRSSRRAIELAALSCPRHLRWKVWLLAARSELWDGSAVASRKLLDQAKADAPSRVQVSVCVERARAEEFLGDLEAARAALEEARSCEGHDWKVYLEHIFMEARHGHLSDARSVALAALEQHPATGRLWSALIALEHSSDKGAVEAMPAFRRAAREVPKSGEVWCEGARIFMNPLSPHFHIGRARKCLEFAVHLTPQYGDSFLELLRLRFLLEMRTRIRRDPLVVGLLRTPSSRDAAAPEETTKRLAVATLVTQRICSRLEAELQDETFAFSAGTEEDDCADPDGDGADEAVVGGDSLDWVGLGDPRGPSRTALSLWRLEMLCAYADPNYGFLWFWCRESSLSSPQEVLARMRGEVADDLWKGGALHAYAWALARGIFRLPEDVDAEINADDVPVKVRERVAEIEKGGLAQVRSPDATPVSANRGSKLSPRDFAIGSLSLARCFTSASTNGGSQAEGKRLIFGSDILCV